MESTIQKLALGVVCTFPVTLAFCAWKNAPVNDEFGHLFAGVCYWQTGDLSIFNVNPPLVRALAALPAVAGGAKFDCPYCTPGNSGRLEFGAGRGEFLKAPKSFQCYLSLGRMLTALFAVVGAVVLYLFGSRLAGPIAGSTAAVLWVVQPQVVSHGALITNDIPCAVAILLSAMQLVRVKSDLTWASVILLGVCVGLALQCKLTSLVLFPVILIVFAKKTETNSISQIVASFVLLMLTVWLVLMIPYRFEGVGYPLKEFEFHSASMSNTQALVGETLGAIRLPLPAELVRGIDTQQDSFEGGVPSYAAGLRAFRGWWWFYFYGMLVKLPVGTLLCSFAAVVLLFSNWRTYSSGLGVCLMLLLAVLVATCMKSDIGRQTRYIFPAYPFLFLIVGVIAARSLGSRDRLLGIRHKLFGRAIMLGILLTIVEFTFVSPHWMSTFNALAGGNKAGFLCLYNDASDWGQDLYLVADWIDTVPRDIPVFVKSETNSEAMLRELTTRVFFRLNEQTIDSLPKPVWVIISKSDYVIHQGIRKKFGGQKVDELIGGTHLAFHFN